MRRLGSVQWGEDWLFFASYSTQGCWRRVSETKHDASEAEGPSNKAEGKKKGRVTPGGGGGGGKLRIHRFALNQTKSKFLRVLVAMQPSKWAGNLRGRDSQDAHGHLHFKRIFSKCITSHTYKMAMLALRLSDKRRCER